MRIPELSNRLMSAVGFVRGGMLADIGTDHAYLPVYLYNSARIRGAVAADINVGPLERAKTNIALCGAEKGIVTVLSDGLAEIEPYHPDDIVIFGMGGELIIRIIRDAPWVRDRSVRLILQPMTKQEEVRAFLLENGFVIVDEVLSEDEGKIYQTLCAEYAPQVDRSCYSRLECLLGRHNISRGGPLFERFLRHRIEVMTVARDGKRRAGRPDAEEESMVEALETLLSEIRKKEDSQ